MVRVIGIQAPEPFCRVDALHMEVIAEVGAKVFERVGHGIGSFQWGTLLEARPGGGTPAGSRIS